MSLDRVERARHRARRSARCHLSPGCKRRGQMIEALIDALVAEIVEEAIGA